jgi:mannose-6-phosphate isomerase-like protein (cupin superfamily)
MSTPRLVVTGTAPDARSVVTADGPPPLSFDAGVAMMHQLWLTTDLDPARDAFADNPPSAPLQQPAAGGSLFQICTFQPHTSSPLHKTDTIDYVVVTSGTIDHETEDGTTVTLSPGDCLVQRATVHRWSNPYDEPCSLAVTCISTSSDPHASVDIEVVDQ